MTKKKPAPTQAGSEPEDTPATEGGLGTQGGTSQPGPPTDAEEVEGEIDFSRPATGEGGTDKA